MALLSNVYTSIAKVKRFMSNDYAIASADHDRDDSADTDVIEDAINWSKEELDSYLLLRYDETTLLTSELVGRWSTLLSACFLAITRGNPLPDSWNMLRQELMERLQKVADGLVQLPGLALREDMRPSMSNLTIDRRYRRSKIRVTPSNSTDAPTKLSQDKSIDYGNSWE